MTKQHIPSPRAYGGHGGETLVKQMRAGRFEYGRYRTRERAELALEDSLAHGDVSLGEFPLVEPRRDHTGKVLYWAITLPL